MTSPPPLPEKIGPYKIEALLDKGGMSFLYLATHPETKEPVAIKVLSQKYLSNSEVVQRFLNEAEIISITNHPHIVKMYGQGRWEGGLYIAMEYVEGTSLRKYILQHPISLKKALTIIIDIAYALCHLHTHGVIHRDLKPENILVSTAGEIKVIDFGIAQLLTGKTAPQTNPSQRLVGTPIYISPEQKENPESVSFPSDIYSLAVISYELILGKLCHGQVHLSLMPPGIQPILHRSLQPNPKARYQDIVGFISDITSYLNSPLFQKECSPADRVSELSEEIGRMQSALVMPQAPKWKDLEIGIATTRDLQAACIYYDFFEQPEGVYVVVAAESSEQAASLIKMAHLRGALRALRRFSSDPKVLVYELNAMLWQDSVRGICNFNYIVLDPSHHRAQSISLGYGNLWHFKQGEDSPHHYSHKDVVLPTKNLEKLELHSFAWEPGDLLVLNTLSSSIDGSARWLENEQSFIETLKNHRQSRTQALAEHLLRRMRMLSGDLTVGRMPTFICIRQG